MNIEEENNKQKVLFIFSAQVWYTRNEYISKLLKNKYSVDVICSKRKGYFFRLLEVFFKFIFLKNKKQYHSIYVGFLAQPLVPLVALLYKGRIVSDFFISLFDTICEDRKIIKPKSFLGKILYKFEKWTLGKSTLVLTDTKQSKKYYINTYNIREDKIRELYVLANEKIFYKREVKKEGIFDVFFYGSNRPLHGIDVILKAAQILKTEDIKFTLIGPIKRNYKELASKLSSEKVEFIDWVDYNDLPDYIAKADICLGGQFSQNKKAKRVIAGKTFQFAVMGKAMILGENKANKELFENKKDCLMVEMGNTEELARAILVLKNDKELLEKIAANAIITIGKIKSINCL